MSARESARELAQEKAQGKAAMKPAHTPARENKTTYELASVETEAKRQHNAMNVAVLRGAITEAGEDAKQGMNLNELENLADAREKLDRWITDAAAAARAAGYSWTDVGNALGTTKQGAQQRYGKSS
jgi:hypothetical protein